MEVRAEDILTWMRLLVSLYLSFIVLSARSLVRVVLSVHLRGRLCAERLGLDPFKCFSS